MVITSLQAHVEHLKLHPDHNFDLSAASVIWRSNNEYECQFVEAACIKSLTNCNISKGDVKLFPPVASLVSNIAVTHKSKRNRNNSGPLRNPLYVSPLIADAPLPLSTAMADSSMLGNNPSLSSTTSTPPVTQPHPFSLRMTPSPLPTISPPLPEVFSYATQLTSPTGSMAPLSTGSIPSPSQLILLSSPVRLPDLSQSDLTPRLAPFLPRPQRILSRKNRCHSQPIQNSFQPENSPSISRIQTQLDIRQNTNDLSTQVLSPLINGLRSHRKLLASRLVTSQHPG